TASTTDAPAGTVTNLAHTNRPGVNIAATPSEVTTVSHHSSRLFSGEYSARWPFRWRWSNSAHAMNRFTMTKTMPVTMNVMFTVSSIIFQLDAIGVNHQGLRKWNRIVPRTSRINTTASAMR